MDSNKSGAVEGDHFRGPWPIWGPLEGSYANSFASGFIAWGIFLAIFWPSLTPPANPVERKSPKWLLQVYHIKYYIFKVGLAPLGSILGHLKSVLVLFRAFRVTFLLGENTLCCFYGILKCQKNPSFENTAKILNSTFCYYVCLWCRKSQNTENTGGVFVVWTLHRIAGCGAQKPGIPTTLSRERSRLL